MPEARVEPSNLNDEELLRQANENRYSSILGTDPPS
jgi:hypothetical protein